jgi:hypothetical protein
MSFQTGQATALPAEVQLAKEKPQGAFCLRSRYALSANSANSWLAGSLVSLPLQTGTPATFTDVKQGNINCTLQISNTNPYVDYLNFGPCGAIIFFDEMRIYSSGTPIEENLRYSETVDLLMEQGGWQAKPYHVYRRNKWRANNGRAGDKHINFIKPSMVDSCGVPMFGRTPFMDNNSAVYNPPSIAFGYEDNVFTNDLALRAVAKGQATFGQVYGTDALGTFNDDALSGTTDAATNANFYKVGTNGRGVSLLNVGRNSTATQKDTAAGGLMTQSDHALWKNTLVARTGTESSALNTAYAHIPCAQYVPSQWPDFQPCTLSGEVDDFEVDMIIGKTKVSEYMKYLSNVRSLPIGVPGNNTSYTDNVGILPPAQAAASNGPAVRFMEYRVSMPFVSGIYGILADKMFPDLLIGANNIRIEFKLAQNQKALWLTMDPCRRVPGTVRDFVPFTGEISGTARGGRFIPAEQTWGKSTAASAALGCSYSRVVPYDSTIGNVGYAVTTLYADSDGGNVQAPVESPVYRIVRNTNMYTTSSAMGEDLVGVQLQSVVAAPAGIPCADTITTGAHFSPFSNLPKPQYVPTATPWAAKNYFTADGTGVFNVAVTATHINESASCYGTYLPASVPQTRRCQPHSRLTIADSFTSQGTTGFAVRDLQYIGEQVQLDDLSASSIIQMAATSEIVVWSRGYRSFEANCTLGEQQNIILPIQIGQATALYLVFRPGTQIQNFDYYANSFSCPFTGVSFDGNKKGAESGVYYGLNGKAADVGGKYVIRSSLDTQNQGQFSYQLFSGTRQYPLQPIQTVSELLVEREKSTHSLHNWAWTGSENMRLTQWNQNFNSSNTTGLSFDPFLDLGYFTTFLPTMGLDDQTITQNPYLAIAEVSDSGAKSAGGTEGRIRGIRQNPAVSTVQSTFVGVLNQYVPPIGTFFLGWDFESWTNHDDLMRTGKFLGQEQLSVRMTGCFLMSATNPQAAYVDPVAQPIQCTAIVPHIVKLSFVPGGHLLTYY